MSSDAAAQCVHEGTGPRVVYRPRSPKDAVLHRIVREHLETFLQEVSSRAGGHPLPAFVEREFRDFISCGSLARGFARFRCESCAFEHLVPFSCKGRAVCSSCTGRRMNERAADLVDHVLGGLPIRQYVLTVPHRLRYLMAFDHRLCRAVLAVFNRALLGMLRRRAKESGVPDPRSGTVTAIQRCGSALDVNLHFHTLAPDGVFDANGEADAFHPLPPPTDNEITRLLTTVRLRVLRLLRRRGLLPGEDAAAPADPAADIAPTLVGLTAAVARGRVATGRRAGQRLRRIGADPDAPWIPHDGPRHAHEDGFDLHANISVHERDRAGLERLARYILRPPVAQNRLRLRDDGLVVLELPRTWSDGTTHILFEPGEFLERLATVIPRPRINLIIYSGVFAGHASGREAAVARAAEPAGRSHQPPAPPDDEEEAKEPRRRHHRWADLMRRAFDCDVLRCPQCPGRLRFIA
ncbi:MAG: transposase, partial [Candidatus Binatia bacterium]|nr:transposase [Candidatus Binatia bacterium]